MAPVSGMRRTQSAYLDPTVLAGAMMNNAGIGRTSKAKSIAQSKHRRKETSCGGEDTPEQAQLGVTQMASVVVRHLFAPLWSIGLSSEDLEASGCLEPVQWKSNKVNHFVTRLDSVLDSFRDQPPSAQFAQVHATLDSSPMLATVFIVLNVSRVEHIEMRRVDAQKKDGKGLYSCLLEELLGKQVKNAERNHTIWNDECYLGNNVRTLTELGGEWNELMFRKPKAAIVSDDLRQIRRALLHLLLLASSTVKYNIRDDNMYHVCDQLCTQMFLISPGEVLSTLCCGEKGPVYLAKYLRFLMSSTGTLCTPLSSDEDPFLPAKVTSPGTINDRNEEVPSAVQDAWLVIFSGLINLAHSKNRKAGQNICAAFAVAIREQMQKIHNIEEKARDLETWIRDHKTSVVKQKQVEKEKALARYPIYDKLSDVLSKFPRSTGKVVEGKKEEKENSIKKMKSELAAHRETLQNLKRPLPSLLAIIRMLLCHVHCYGEDAPRAWGELMVAITPLQVYSSKTGSLATDIHRAAASAVQCLDCLLRYRMSRAFVKGTEMVTFKRERAFLLVNPLASRAKVLCKMFLGNVPLAAHPLASHRGKGLLGTGVMGSSANLMSNSSFGSAGRAQSHLALVDELLRNNCTDDVLAPFSLTLNVLLRIAKNEDEKDPSKRLAPLDMHDTLSQIPPLVLSQYYPELHRLLTGPVGGVGRAMPFSEGSGETLHVVPTLYKSLLGLYSQIRDESGHMVHEDVLHMHVPSPFNPMHDLALTVLPFDEKEDDKEKKDDGKDPPPDSARGGRGGHGAGGYVCKSNEDIKTSTNEWASLLLGIIEKEMRYYAKEEDHWGNVHPNIAPYEIKLVMAGGSGTVHSFVNGLAKLSSTSRLPRYPIFRVYPLPLGKENLLCNWLQKQDAVYHQLVSWPLQQAARDPNLARLSTSDFIDSLRDQYAPDKHPETTESFSLRRALDTYLIDTDKSARVYVYKCECWRPSEGPGQYSNQADQADHPDTSDLDRDKADAGGAARQSLDGKADDALRRDQGGSDHLGSKDAGDGKKADGAGKDGRKDGTSSSPRGYSQEAPGVVFAWCQQLEFGPASDAARVLRKQRGGEASEAKPRPELRRGATSHTKSFTNLNLTPRGLPMSHSMVDLYEEAPGGGGSGGAGLLGGGLLGGSDDLGTASVLGPSLAEQRMTSRSLSPAGGRGKAGRAGSISSRQRTGSHNRSEREFDPAMLQQLHMPNKKILGNYTAKELWEALRDSRVFSMKQELGGLPVKIALGSAIVQWIDENVPECQGPPRANTLRAAALLLEQHMIATAPSSAMQDGTPQSELLSVSPSEGDNLIFNVNQTYKLGPPPQTHSVQPRKLTMVQEPPTQVEIQHIPFAGGQDYPDLRQGRDLWIHKVSLRNVGKEGDAGLYPDPTEPALQMYVYGSKKREKVGNKPVTGGEGQNYSVLGQLTVTAKGEPFHVVADGTLYGPFRKIVVSPWLDVERGDWSSHKKMHLSFDVMGFIPLGGSN